MKNQSKLRVRAFAIAASVFTISTTVGQVLTIRDLWIQVVMLVPNVASWLYVAYSLLVDPQKKVRTQVAILSSVLKNEPELEFRYLREEEELTQAWELDELAYRDHNPEFNLLSEWWKVYPIGVHAFFRGPNLLATLGIWPLTADAFEGLKEGSRKENSIMKDDIVPMPEAGDCQTWYFAGLVMSTAEQLMNPLICRTLTEWLDKCTEGPIKIVGLGYTREDEDVFEVLQFRRYKDKGADGLPIYYYSKPSHAHLSAVVTTLSAVVPS